MPNTTAAVHREGSCPYCSGDGDYIYHSGVCPKIKEIEYYPNGTIKKVTFEGGENA